MVEPLPQFIPEEKISEEEVSESTLEDFISLIDHDQIMQTYLEFTGRHIDDQQEMEQMEAELLWEKDLLKLIERAQETLSTDVHNRENSIINEQIIERARSILNFAENFLNLAMQSKESISDQASNEQFKNNPLVNWLCDASGSISTVDSLDNILYKQPVKEAEFSSWPQEKQELWDQFASDFKIAQSEARQWFEEKERLKLIKPHKDDFFDGVMYDFDPKQTVLLDKGSPNHNPKNHIFQTLSPCLQFRYRIIKKGFVKLEKLRK